MLTSSDKRRLITEMAHNSTTLKSQTQKGKAAEASSFCQHELNEEEPLLSVEEVIYSDLATAVKELQKGGKTQRQSVPQ